MTRSCRTALWLAAIIIAAAQFDPAQTSAQSPRPLGIVDLLSVPRLADPRVLPDGSALLFTAPDPKTAEEKQRDKNKDDVYAFDENFKQTHLWKVDVKTGAETRLTGGDFSVTNYTVANDGRTIALHRQPTPLLG